MRDDVARAAALRALEIAREAKAMKSEKGDKGDPGETRVLNIPVPGEQGPMGPTGARGPMGPFGPRGAQGERGDPGPQGPDGKQGPAGPAGTSGKDGAAGPKGERGLKGDKGDKGDLGPMPKFERKGLMFRFEKSPGVWGEWIVVPTGGGGGGRDDKLTDRQKQLVEIAELIKSKEANGGKVIGSDGTNLIWTEGGGGGGAVDSVNGQTGVVVLDAADVGALPTTGGTVTGPTVVSMSSTSTALRVTQTGTGNAFVVEDSTNPDSSPFVVTSAGFVGIRNSSPATSLDVTGSALISGFLEVGTAVEINAGTSYLNAFSGDTFLGGTGDLYLETGSSQTVLQASATTQNVGIGVAPNTSKLAVAGVVESTTGGVKFPDGTIQTTASTGGGVTIDDVIAFSIAL